MNRGNAAIFKDILNHAEASNTIESHVASSSVGSAVKLIIQQLGVLLKHSDGKEVEQDLACHRFLSVIGTSVSNTRYGTYARLRAVSLTH